MYTFLSSIDDKTRRRMMERALEDLEPNMRDAVKRLIEDERTRPAPRAQFYMVHNRIEEMRGLKNCLGGMC